MIASLLSSLGNRVTTHLKKKKVERKKGKQTALLPIFPSPAIWNAGVITGTPKNTLDAEMAVRIGGKSGLGPG